MGRNGRESCLLPHRYKVTYLFFVLIAWAQAARKHRQHVILGSKAENRPQMKNEPCRQLILALLKKHIKLVYVALWRKEGRNDLGLNRLKAALTWVETSMVLPHMLSWWNKNRLEDRKQVAYSW